MPIMNGSSLQGTGRAPRLSNAYLPSIHYLSQVLAPTRNTYSSSDDFFDTANSNLTNEVDKLLTHAKLPSLDLNHKLWAAYLQMFGILVWGERFILSSDG